MDDDIDIEEHNLMENPQVQLMFPDISVLKQEILDSYDSEDKNQDETLEISKEYGSIIPSFVVTKTEPQSNESGISPYISTQLESNVPKSVYGEPYFRTKIIIGTKPNTEKQYDKKLKLKVNVCIKNINNYLVNSSRFCNNCDILFSSKQNYRNHLSLDCAMSKNKETSTYKDGMTKPKLKNNQVNVMVDIHTKDYQNEKRQSLNKCFHCNVFFPNQNSLIDHLYEVLDSKTSKSKSIEDECIANLDNLHDSEKNVHSNDTAVVYQCQICSYYFNQIKFFEMHQLRKHGLKISSNISKVIFNPKCQYCYVEYANIKYYNLHMIKKHRDIVTKIVGNAPAQVTSDVETSFSKGNSLDKCESEDDLSQKFINSTSKKSTVSQKVMRNQSETPFDYGNIVIFKSLIFKCLKCHVHFLSSDVAINHEEHNQMLINWKCPKCLKIFKRNDEKLHSEQHLYSTSFIVYDLSKSDTGKVLIKCPKCTTHFHESDFAKHSSLCGKNQLDSAYCSRCDILINEKVLKLHQKNHKNKRMLADDFIVIDFDKQCMTTSNLFPEETTKRKKQLNSDAKSSKRMKLILDHISSASDSSQLNIVSKQTKSKENIEDSSLSWHEDSSSSWHDDESLSTRLNQNNKNGSVAATNDSDDDSSNSESAVTSMVKRSVRKNSKIKNNSVKNGIDSGFDAVSDIGNTERPKRKFIKNSKYPEKSSVSKSVFIKKHIKKVIRKTKYPEIQRKVLEKTRGDAKHKKFNFTNTSQLSVLHLTYCDFCECYITARYHIDFHTKSLCTEIQKRVCKICGIVVTGKGSTAHKAFHKLNPSLTLNDFTFYDIKSNKIVQPPIPKYPKCDLCEIHFTSKVDIIGHVCSEVNFMQCNLCEIKLSDIAFKLHMPFHAYGKETLDFDEDNFSAVTHFTDSLEAKRSDIDDIIEINPEPKSSDLKLGCILFSCKTCNVCVSTYDGLVKHCHSHYDRDEIDRKWMECVHCNLKFESYSYKQHQDSHSQGISKEDFKIINIDVFYFGCSNDDWTKYVFKSLSQEEKAQILENAIYKVESRIQMEISQEGPLNLTMYRCEKCRCFVDNVFIYKHVENCVGKYSINPCQFCGINLMSAAIRNQHEESVHKITGITLKSYRIISFNRKEHKLLNNAIANKTNCYVLYKCRNCNGIIDDSTNHQCYLAELKKCIDCGLLIYEVNYDQHVSKHKDLDSFTISNMKVILVGRRTNQIHESKLECSFSGIVYDYTFYKCVKCEVCVRSVRPSLKHFCLIDAAKSKCPKCYLTFDEGKLKFHLKQHSTDLDFVRKNMLIIDFDPDNPSKSLETEVNDQMTTETSDQVSTKNNTTKTIIEKTDTVYKCACGLHHLTKSNYNEHSNKKIKCNSNKKVLKQKCFKCGLDFTPNVLFKHLLIHHGDINVEYKLNVVKVEN